MRLSHVLLRLLHGFSPQRAVRTYFSTHTSPVRAARVGRAILLGCGHRVFRDSSVLDRLDTSGPTITTTHRLRYIQYCALLFHTRFAFPRRLVSQTSTFHVRPEATATPNIRCSELLRLSRAMLSRPRLSAHRAWLAPACAVADLGPLSVARVS